VSYRFLRLLAAILTFLRQSHVRFRTASSRTRHDRSLVESPEFRRTEGPAMDITDRKN